MTAGAAGQEAALTVSSLMVAEGEPGLVFLLVGSTTDLWEAIERSEGRFVVHILDAEHREDADAFAGVRPRPGGVFAGVAMENSEWGPVLNDFSNRLYCRRSAHTELPFHFLLEATIEEVDVSELIDPAVYFRGDYRRLE